MGQRSGDVNECLVEFNPEFMTAEDVLASVTMTDEEKAALL